MIVGIGFIQSIIGVAQFSLQHSIGLIWLKESIISPSIPGVAKIILDNHKIIRAYGLMPHPNILGGFLSLCIILLLYLTRIFHGQNQEPHNNTQIVPRGTISASTSKPQKKTDYPYILLKKSLFKNKWLIYCIFLVLALGLLLTLSKSAILGLFLALVYIFIIVPRGTNATLGNQLLINFKRQIYSLKEMFHVEHSRIFIISLAIIIISSFLILKPSLHSIFIQSLEERGIYLDISYHAIIANPLIGIGAGQFVWKMQDFSSMILSSWQYQPVHNVFLLIWSELGIVGLGLFTWLIWTLFYSSESPIVPRGTIGEKTIATKENLAGDSIAILDNTFHVLSTESILPYFKAIFLSFLFIMLFDHYFWDIQQGSLMLWMVMGVIAGIE
ncbi:MAG: O-antigen ligase family protein [Candidatus Pacebacteria bacterium]|nr:O-antigen ligase family protein [Candidatus Paceibacterota bacterium]